MAQVLQKQDPYDYGSHVQRLAWFFNIYMSLMPIRISSSPQMATHADLLPQYGIVGRLYISRTSMTPISGIY